jgi:hypothetical protein
VATFRQVSLFFFSFGVRTLEIPRQGCIGMLGVRTGRGCSPVQESKKHSHLGAAEQFLPIDCAYKIIDIYKLTAR